MPNKTIYISDNDLPIVDTAAELSGGLSWQKIPFFDFHNINLTLLRHRHL